MASRISENASTGEPQPHSLLAPVLVSGGVSKSGMKLTASSTHKCSQNHLSQLLYKTVASNLKKSKPWPLLRL